MKKFPTRLAGTLAVLVGLLAASTLPAQAPDPASEQPDQAPANIMKVDDVRVGMKGYGLSVFHGTKVEPFPVEVISVQHDFGPKRAVVWVRCPSERMQKSGPVAGMSGSPIYLWDENEPEKIGEGGRLIGAFAFGYSMSKDCYVGIQPIELMRDAAGRIGSEPLPEHAQATGWAPAAHAMRSLLAAGQVHPAAAGPASAIERLIQHQQPGELKLDRPEPVQSPHGSSLRPLAMPMPVGSGELASALRPMLAPMGLMPLEAPAQINSQLPPGIDRDSIKLEPGSVLSIPLAFGDLDLAATGTVTDVTPDGTVLGFGHAMNGVGATALPMATGYVHLVMPTLNTSFKLGGSASIVGSLLRDEAAAVVGQPVTAYKTSPASVTIRMPGQPDRAYRYDVVQHPQLTPVIASVTAAQSLQAVQNLPPLNTVRLTGQISFDGGDRTLKLDSTLPNGSQTAVLMQLMPALSTMASNPHEAVMMQSMDLQIDVSREVAQASLVDARLNRSQVHPGDELSLTVQLQPFGGAIEKRQAQLKIPADLPEGEYQVSVLDAAGYSEMMLQSRPHLMRTRNADQLFDVLQQVYSVDNTAFYVVMWLPSEGLAIGREELPRLPSSKRALLSAPTSTIAVPFVEWTSQKSDVPWVTQGQLSFPIQVTHEADRQ